MVQVKKEVTKKAAGKLGKAAGVLNTVFSVIPDTVAIVGDITAKAAPIVDKHLEYNRAYKERLIQVPNLLDVPVKEAKRLLEERDLVVLTIPVKPTLKYAQADTDEVLHMTPKSGKVVPASIVKLYYLTAEVKRASQHMAEIDALKKEEQNRKIQESFKKVTDFLPKKK
ncbi:hypothetical protein J2T50_000376 [Streptococcus gallinaceus]|nr:PASTA domain-containing protein [Streptococcus gallinaceus]MCP1638683.1 hypothetical protein [Streptococcus gallinaceus]MCP1769230.1 hypothetical protein [Streptococcus gallinaceus]